MAKDGKDIGEIDILKRRPVPEKIVRRVGGDGPRGIEMPEPGVREKKLAAKNLGQYIDFLRVNKKKEALANFTSIFEKGTYEQAIVFMVVNATEVYDMLNEFVEKL